MHIPVTFGPRYRHRCVILLVTVFCFCSGALAFQATIPAHLSPTKCYGDNNSCRQSDITPLILCSASSKGHDDWYIDESEEDEIDHTPSSPIIEGALEREDVIEEKDDDIRTYFATCIPGLQETLAAELIGLGANHVEMQGKSGVRFEGSPNVGLQSILWCRTAHKIMELIGSSDQPVDDEFDYQNDSSQGIRNREDLYRYIQSAVHTPSLLGDGSGGLLTISVSTIYASKPPNKELCHGHFTALTVKNALVDAVRDLREDGIRPDVDVEDADVPLVLVMRGRRARGGWNMRRGRQYGGGRYGEEEEEQEEKVADVDLYRILHAGGSLHRRGYRQANVDASWEEEEGGEDDWNGRQSSVGNAPVHRAAMKESMAAGLLLEAGWDKLVLAARGDGKGAVLVDPMTGSGTFPTEAALIACDMAPGLLRIAGWRGRTGTNPHRQPPCIRWKDFSNVEVWDELVAKATKRAKSGMKWALSPSQTGQRNVKILCNEMNPRAASLAQNSIRNSNMKSIISLNEGDCIDWDLGGGDPANSDMEVVPGRTIFVCNPVSLFYLIYVYHYFVEQHFAYANYLHKYASPGV